MKVWSVSKTSSTRTPRALAFARSRSTKICGVTERNVVKTFASSGRSRVRSMKVCDIAESASRVPPERSSS
jgi:hypothetical protein